ncbi:MAG: ABC transporter ATP-binding protein [Acidobacteria bacterium]|nr:ABC transporter ATP-binding protein [Acidobacteriota bacterium]
MPPLLRVERVSRIYQEESQPVVAVRDVSLQLEAGAFVALMGPSGCGKSTLLHIMGAMDRPTRGEIWLEEEPLHLRGEEELTRIRRTRVGFVFQFFYLLPTLTVTENVALPLLLAQRNHAEEKAAALLDAVRLSHRRNALPGQLSGGEMQRAAIARALVHNPPLVIADEPTGNLDSDNGEQILRLLAGLCGERNTTVVMATHSGSAAGFAGRILRMKDGRLL